MYNFFWFFFSFLFRDSSFPFGLNMAAEKVDNSLMTD